MQTTIQTFNRQSQADRIEQLLRSRDFVPTAALRLFAYQYNARIKELRDRGLLIEACRQDGVHGFRMVRQ